MSPRAAHAAEQPAHPGPAAGREPVRQPHRQAGRVRPVIHGAGSDLLQLINDILDLSKVEAGKMDVHPGRGVAGPACSTTSRRPCGPLTADKGARLHRRRGPGELPESLHTDERRLQQILRNLLSNAVKFTEVGEVRLVVSLAERNPVPELGAAPRPGGRLPGDRHRHRHPDRQAARSSSRRSSRPTAPPAAGTAAPGWACRSAGRSRTCSAARSTPRARVGRGQHLHPLPARPTRGAGRGPAAGGVPGGGGAGPAGAVGGGGRAGAGALRPDAVLRPASGC